MAAYAAFKHVELYNVGNTKKRVLKPPGGGSSDLFNGDIPSTPRSVKNYMRSNIFSAPENINKTGDKPRKVQPMDSYNRLFGENERPITPAKNRMRSNIPIGSDAADGKVNKGVTNGEAKNGHANGHSETNGKHTTNGNGLGNLTNISENGSSKSQIISDTKTPDSAYGTKSSDSITNINSTFTNDDSVSTSESTNTSFLTESPKQKKCVQRNPVTGTGIEFAHKPRSRCGYKRDGNPVTGEGYITKLASTETNGSSNAGHVINKNRIPPGGFSSGLW